ncbi:MAG: PepSY-associated TM helix domain-containing protein [Methylophilaceae bacterium]|uniref:PepSY-associated TM helix domain-containing protein n=1 Tax=Methylovorus sp. MM2 TaxID=1848038 RepID=UPI000A57B9BF|nr:PepSY-associated TM helix domain-containing protein [Methylovorus sp. MM2]
MQTKPDIQIQKDQKNRAFWLKHLYRWHWISSAACLIGMLLFASTGITLNNAAHIESVPVISKKSATVPDALLKQIKAEPATDNAVLPKAISDWVSDAIGVELAGVSGEWSDAEVYLSLPRPGGDAWLVIDRASGEVNYERTDRGWVSYFNDLHKGRNTGTAWSWFLDIFSITALVFCITGLFMLSMHAGNRPATWPLVGLGVVLPLVLVILFIH